MLAREQNERPIRHVVALRLRDFQAFEQLRRTGSVTFDTTVAEFDLAYRGTFMLRLLDVEVHVRALTTPSGIRGVLSKSGLSWLRVQRQGRAARRAQRRQRLDHRNARRRTGSRPWYRATRASYCRRWTSAATASCRTQDEGEARRLFERSGVGATWTLTLEPSANEDLDMSTVTDVDLILYLTAQYDAALADAVELERRKEIARGLDPQTRAQGYAFRDTLPDTFYHLLNGGEGTLPLERVVTFEVTAGEFPHGQVNRQVEGITVAFLSASGPQPMTFAISSAAHSPAYDRAKDDRSALVLEPSAGATTDPSAPNVYGYTNFDQAPEDRWFLRLAADDNPSLAVTDGGGSRSRSA